MQGNITYPGDVWAYCGDKTIYVTLAAWKISRHSDTHMSSVLGHALVFERSDGGTREVISRPEKEATR